MVTNCDLTLALGTFHAMKKIRGHFFQFCDTKKLAYFSKNRKLKKSQIFLIWEIFPIFPEHQNLSKKKEKKEK
jgi:hypothetical protein